MGRKGKVAYLYDGNTKLDLLGSSSQSVPGPPVVTAITTAFS